MGERAVPLPPSRPLTHSEAAAYCRLSPPMFARFCRVRPLSLDADGTVQRYDQLDLDQWIKALKSTQPATDDEILARLG